MKTWFVTGVSGGLGEAIALHAAKAGDLVFGTLRKEDQLDAFKKLVPGKTFPLLLDVNHHHSIAQVVNQVIEAQSKIDVLVNNAGYGLFGAIEEISMEEARQQMETNFFSVLAITKAVLPFMRRQKSGHIIQMSSVSGFVSKPGLGLYNASKYALEGFSEALYHETKPLNIRVSIIEPGPFRTAWAGSSSSHAKVSIEAYEPTAGTFITNYLDNIHGNQPGDPIKAAQVIFEVVYSDNPPVHLPLGEIALRGVREKLKAMESDISEWEEISLNTAFN